MASDALTAALAGEQYSCGRVLIVKDTMHVGASFVMQALLRRALQQRDKVLLVALEQTPAKYMYCMRKLGVALGSLVDSGQLIMIGAHDVGMTSPSLEGSNGVLKQLHTRLIDSLARLTNSQTGDAASGIREGVPAPSTPGVSTPGVSTPGDAAGGTSSDGSGVTVMVDGASALATYAASGRDWLGFVQWMVSLERYVPKGLPCTSILMAHGDVPADDAWVCCLEHAADVVLDVAPLEAQMADIDGTVTVFTRSMCGRAQGSMDGRGGGDGEGVSADLVECDEAVDVEQKLYFRAGETGIRWMPHIDAAELLSVARS